MTNAQTDTPAPCDRCNQSESSHTGLEKFCPFYSTFRAASPAPALQLENRLAEAEGLIAEIHALSVPMPKGVRGEQSQEWWAEKARNEVGDPTTGVPESAASPALTDTQQQRVAEIREQAINGSPAGYEYDEAIADLRFLLDLVARFGAGDATAYADKVLRFSATVPCLIELLGEDDDGGCECYGCAGRKYVALADSARQGSHPEDV